MPDYSDTTVFQLVNHNILPNNVVVCYREHDADSYEVADYYRLLRKIPPENLISLPCVADHTITETEMVDNIEIPLLTAILRLESGLDSHPVSHGHHQKQIWVIVLCFNIPNVYVNPLGDHIAVASRLHRLGKPNYVKFEHHFYGKEVIRFFDHQDANKLYITAVLDGPNKQVVKRMIKSAVDADLQAFISGNFYIDPYGKDSTTAEQNYEDDLELFVNEDANLLGLNVISTTHFPNQDALINSMKKDCFYWGWYINRYSPDLFTYINQTRVFLYNADDDSAGYLRDGLFDQMGSPWCNVAMNISPPYAATAGSIGGSGISEDPYDPYAIADAADSYLRPRPFFRYLHRGASLGESFLASSRYVEWKIILIGDPLLVVTFPNDAKEEPGLPSAGSNAGGDSPGIMSSRIINNASPVDQNVETFDANQVLIEIKNILEISLAYSLRQANITQNIFNDVINSHDLDENNRLLLPTYRWRNYKDEDSRLKFFMPVVSQWVNMITKSNSLTINDWIEGNTDMISSSLSDLVTDVSKQEVQSGLIMPTGFWIFTFNYTHTIQTSENVHFILQMSTYSNFSVIVKEFNSLTSSDGWYYEYRVNNFISMYNGFPTTHENRRVRYKSLAGDYLTKYEIYYVRWRAIHDNGDPITDFINAPTPMIIKG